MSVLTTTQSAFGASHFPHPGKAVRALLVALAAFRPRRSGAARTQDIFSSGRCEAVMPNLAQELRFMASRG